MQEIKKVLFFLPSSVGGAERMTITIAKMLDKATYQVCFVIVGKSIHPISEFIHDSYSIRHLHVYNIWDFGFMKILGVIRKEKPYAVFSSMMYLNVRVILAAHLNRVKRIIVRNDSHLSLAPPYVRFLIKRHYPNAHHIIAQQVEMGDELKSLLRCHSSKVVVLQNPIDVQLIENKLKGVESPFTNHDEIRYVCVASVYYWKGQDVLIRAFSKLRKIMTNVHLFLVGSVGDRDFESKLHSLISTCDLSTSVTFVGYTDNPYKWIRYSDCFVLPSRIEGLPNSLIEAQYLGIPVVATQSIPLISRLISNGINGYSVPVDDADSMCEAMIKAPQLKNVRMTYQPSTEKEFTSLFE